MPIIPTHVSVTPTFEDDGRPFITETQKSVARVHEVPPWLLDRLWPER